MKTFKGRVVVPGTCTAEALVSHGGFNTLASYQMGMMFGDKQMKCGDQNNAEIYKKPMIGKAMCLPMTIGSTTGGMVLFTVCALGKQAACSFQSRLTRWQPRVQYSATCGRMQRCPLSTAWVMSSSNTSKPAQRSP